jgi:uncharacterized protein YerC
VANTNKEDEVDILFDAILTPREINDMARRLAAIRMLNQGSSYLDVRRELGLNPNTIARLSGHIGYGFRRSYLSVKQADPQKEKKLRRPIRRYKGAIPIYRIIG